MADILRGWKEIADVLTIDVRTAQRWAETRGMPVHGEGRKWARRAELETWARAHDIPTSSAVAS